MQDSKRHYFISLQKIQNLSIIVLVKLQSWQWKWFLQNTKLSINFDVFSTKIDIL